VKDAFDLHGCNGTTRYGRQKNTTQGIAQRVTETTFQRFQHYLRGTIVDRLNIYDTWLEELGDLALHEKPS
jgi:hypothetical protein